MRLLSITLALVLAASAAHGQFLTQRQNVPGTWLIHDVTHDAVTALTPEGLHSWPLDYLELYTLDMDGYADPGVIYLADTVHDLQAGNFTATTRDPEGWDLDVSHATLTIYTGEGHSRTISRSVLIDHANPLASDNPHLLRTALWATNYDVSQAPAFAADTVITELTTLRADVGSLIEDNQTLQQQVLFLEDWAAQLQAERDQMEIERDEALALIEPLQQQIALLEAELDGIHDDYQQQIAGILADHAEREALYLQLIAAIRQDIADAQ